MFSPNLIVQCKNRCCLNSCSGVVICRWCCNPGLSDAQIDLHGKIMQCLSVSEIMLWVFFTVSADFFSDSDLASISSLLASILSLTARIHCCHPTSQHSNLHTNVQTYTITLCRFLSKSQFIFDMRDPGFKPRFRSSWWADVPLRWWLVSVSVKTTTLRMGGNVYRVTHLCTVSCQIQDMNVHMSSKIAS